MIIHNVNRLFCSTLLQQAREDFYKHYPRESLKGIWTWRDTTGTNTYYEVHVPKNEWFPEGLFWSGSADNASDAKSKLLFSLIDKKEKEK